MKKIGYKRITKDDNLIGYYKDNKIYDLEYRITGNIAENKIYESEKEIGYIDGKKLYRNDKTYLGQIEFNNKILLILLLVLITIIVTILSLTMAISNNRGSNEEQTIEIGPGESAKIVDILYNDYAKKDKNGNNLLAPGSTASYKFTLYNKKTRELVYRIQFEDNNSYKLPIKYRLKKDGYYILEDNWKELDKIALQDLTLEANGKTEYELEWIWDKNVSDEFDTRVGIEGKIVYMIKVSILEEEK